MMDVKVEIGTVGSLLDLNRICNHLSERSPQPMVAVDGTTHLVVYLNNAFARLVNRAKKDLIGRSFAEAVPEGEENSCLALLDRVFSSGIPEQLAEQEHRQVQAGPGPVYWSYSAWPIVDANGRPAGVMIQVTDITETAIFRRQSVAMNEALMVSATGQHRLTEVGKLFGVQMQAALERRDHFLAVLSHELRNPLAAIRNGMQVLKLAGNDTSAAENSREMMERQLIQLVRLVDDLLDVSRISTGKLVLRKERVDLASVLENAIESSRAIMAQQGHQFTVTLSAEPILLDADPTRLTQVFLNMLHNAAKYTEPGGQVRLSVRHDGHEVTVSVLDTGIGIPAAVLPLIFDIFVQVDPAWKRAQGGLGIGLSLVKEYVELHGGRVEAFSSGPGQGSEFVVHLPLVIEKTSAPLPTIDADTVPGIHHRVLVVDDNRDSAESMAMILGFMGHEVRTAFDGEAAVAAAAEFQPAIILMDIGMPKVDGYEAARRIRAMPWGGKPFLVALTGWGSDGDRERTTAAGFDRHLVKPVDPDELVKLIAELRTSLPGKVEQ